MFPSPGARWTTTMLRPDESTKFAATHSVVFVAEHVVPSELVLKLVHCWTLLPSSLEWNTNCGRPPPCELSIISVSVTIEPTYCNGTMSAWLSQVHGWARGWIGHVWRLGLDGALIEKS
jgi:hypothetical protein